MSKEAPRWASVADAARYMDASPKFVRPLIAQGEITGYRVGTRTIRVDLREIDAAMKPIPTAALATYLNDYQPEKEA